jgi:hypothetical protein
VFGSGVGPETMLGIPGLFGVDAEGLTSCGSRERRIRFAAVYGRCWDRRRERKLGEAEGHNGHGKGA